MSAPLPHGQTGGAIAASLRQAILSGDFKPGERIRQDHLAEQFGASRQPVREALKTLHSEGLVKLVANAGAWVASLSLEECEELYRVRERLEPVLLRMSVPNVQASTIQRMRALATAMEETPSIETFLKLDREFHFASMGSIQTRMLRDMVTTLWNQTHHYRREVTKMIFHDRDPSPHFDHHLIVNALNRRDAVEAERVLSIHIRRTRHQLTNHPQIFEMPR